jgi:diguanylate cyclase (GGDEF)-like protein/PAS domain S-box-containing protein
LRTAEEVRDHHDAEPQEGEDRRSEADAQQRQLIADISHELKTPLSITIGLLDRVLNDSVLPAPAHRDILAACRRAQSMQVQVDQLLAVARIEAGRFEFVPVPCDLADLARRVATGFDSVATAHDVSLDVQVPPSVIVIADPERVASAITNLVSNALKATPPGGRVRVKLRERHGKARLEVSDTGPGVPARLREAIFERFRQGGGDLLGGSGIGLALVKEIVTRHGGSISIATAPGGGALFRLEFGLAPPGAAAAPPPDIGAVIRPSRERLRGHLSRRPDAPRQLGKPDGRPRIMLVGDDVELGLWLTDHLSDRYAIQRVGSAEDALQELERQPPDVLLTDLALPVMSGGALIEELRSRPEHDQMPIVALCGEPDPALGERLLRAGAQDFVRTPFTEGELAARIDGIVARRAEELRVRETAALAEATYEQAPLGVGVVGRDGRWRRANHALCSLLGYSARELRQMTLDEVTAPEDVGVERRHLEDALAGRTRGFQIEKRLRRADGEYMWTLLSVAPVADGLQGPHLVVLVDDIGERRAMEDRLRQLAVNDELTGLPCRREFERRLGRRLRRARSCGALLLVDIDGFAALNRRHGVAVGDRMLRAVARAVVATAPRGALAGRVHGDRMAVLLTRTSPAAVREVAAALGDAARRCGVSARGNRIRLSASIGGATLPPGTSVDAAFAAAEQALEKVKRAGGGGIEVLAGPFKSRGRVRRTRATGTAAPLRRTVG